MARGTRGKASCVKAGAPVFAALSPFPRSTAYA
ncbi:hypothetical protein RD1_2017 [Roseobacter denitrificans OCh 114]|uniref:Uncharacterized protein n=1 Tax=Roseobacter denitrificans (strain ATCC 33942 / OCh 114) TaxID=375451 RepID=Q168H3_ROSDO|nr:hypothetical protein RD1_2017 [Roseobacter denitrificans OCh 114]